MSEASGGGPHERAVRFRPVGWWEDYRCGCVSPTSKVKRDLPGYCPKHGDCRRQVWPQMPEVKPNAELSGAGRGAATEPGRSPASDLSALLGADGEHHDRRL